MYYNTHNFTTDFPRAKNYYTQESIVEAFPHLKDLNDANFDINSIPEHAQFFILRSSNDDNIHKAVKYHLWCTTSGGKVALSNAWKDAEKKGLTPEIYLIFSVVNSNHFLGVAKMTSDMKDDETFKYWWEPMKWFGSFQIQWLFIKDIHESIFDKMKEENAGTNSFVNMKDSSKLSYENGKEVLAIFRDYESKTSIFGFFSFMDLREDYIRNLRENDESFTKSFNENCQAYQSNPESFSPAKKTYTRRTGGSKYYGGGNYYNSFGNNKRQGNTYYRKTYTATKQSNNGVANGRNISSHKNGVPQQFLSEEEYPPLSLAEQYGIKPLAKKKTALRLPKKGDESVAKEGEKAEEQQSN